MVMSYRQEEYIKDEMRNLKRELIRAKEVTKSLIDVFAMATYYHRYRYRNAIFRN